MIDFENMVTVLSFMPAAASEQDSYSHARAMVNHL
jgi:hypothetical protein